MKKCFFAVAAALVLFSINASGQVSFGIKGGMNLSNVKFSESGFTITPDDLAGFHAGVVADIPVAANLFLQPGLFVSRKGFNYSVSETIDPGYVYPEVSQAYNLDYDVTAKPLYVELPVLVSYRVPIGPELSLALEAGPYASYGIGGNIDYKVSVGTEKMSDSMKFFEDFDIQRFDAGAQFGLGLYVDRFLFGVAYQMGMMNMSVKKIGSEVVLEPDTKAVNRNFMVSAGIRF